MSHGTHPKQCSRPWMCVHASTNPNRPPTYKVSSTGVLTFDVSALTTPPKANVALPNASIPNNSICIWGLDGYGTNDNVVSKTFGTAPNRQHWVSFTSYNVNGGAATAWTYWSIVMEETSNTIYIVDQRHGNYTLPLAMTLGVQINSTTAISVVGSPAARQWAGLDATPADNSYYEFKVGTRMAVDVEGASINNAPNLSLTQSPFTISGKLTNRGSSNVTSYNFNYRVNNGPTFSSSVSSVNIGTDSTFTATSTQPWVPTTAGTYTVNIWASNINGVADMNMTNDTATKVINVVPSMVQRVSLYEVFTSSTCGPCVAHNSNMKPIFNTNFPNHTLIKYQMSWPAPGDPYYYAADGLPRRTLYGVNSIPDMFVNGVKKSGAAGSYSQATYDSDKGVPSFMRVNGTYNVVGRTVNANVTVDPVANNNSANLVLHVAVVEKLTTGNIGTNGETSFMHVMMKMMPDANGTVVPAMTAGTKFTKSLSYTFPAGAFVEEMSDLIVVAFVQDKVTKEVFQSGNMSSNVSVKDNSAFSGIVNIYPNPANNMINVNYEIKSNEKVSINVTNLAGQVVATKNNGSQVSGSYKSEMDLSSLANGLYLVQLKVGDRVHTEKISVVK